MVTSIELLLLTYGCKGMYGARYYGQVEYITVVLIGEQKLLSPSFIFFNVVQHLPSISSLYHVQRFLISDY